MRPTRPRRRALLPILAAAAASAVAARAAPAPPPAAAPPARPAAATRPAAVAATTRPAVRATPAAVVAPVARAAAAVLVAPTPRPATPQVAPARPVTVAAPAPVRPVTRAPTIAALAAAPTPAIPPGPPVPMDFPADGVELKTLLDIVTKRLKIPILYDEQIANKRVFIRVPIDVPEGALLGVLQSALRMKQLALVDAEQRGWKQVVSLQNLPAVARAGNVGAAGATGTADDGGAPLIQVFTLRHADPARVAETLRPYLSNPGGNVQAAVGQRALIVTDYPTVVRRAAQIIELLDGDAAQVAVRFVPLKQAEASQIVTTVSQLLAAKENAQGGGGGGATPGASGVAGVYLAADERSNQVVVTAPAARVNEITALIDGLDQAIDLDTKVYKLKTLSPDRLDRLVKNLLGTAAKRAYESTADRESNALLVSATPAVHGRIAALVKELDVATPEGQSPIRFYKLKNTKAADVLATINGLYGDSGPEGGPRADVGANDASATGPAHRTGNADDAGTGAAREAASTLAGARGYAASTLSPAGASASPVATPAAIPGTVGGARPLGAASDPTFAGATPGSRYRTAGVYPDDLPPAAAAGGAVRGANATVAADLNTNSLIVIAPPAVQQQYADLIRRLDERRPQVQIECTIVTLDTSDNFTFGVDVGRLGGSGASKLLSFSSFGIAGVDPTTGRLSPVAAQGGTFALLSPTVADVVLRALADDSHSRLVSSPQLLVNDNGKGRLQSVMQEPFAEILDTATTQSRTGLGGQAQAGTTISVEPHISEGDYLQLGYSIELSNFTGQGSAGLPPPSQKNAVESAVTIPDGYTIVVGGLSVRNFREAVQSVPFLNQIPIVKYLFGARSKTNTETTLFVFIRPVILRDDKFEDLKYASEKQVRAAGLPGDFPTSEPVPMR